MAFRESREIIITENVLKERESGGKKCNKCTWKPYVDPKTNQPNFGPSIDSKDRYCFSCYDCLRDIRHERARLKKLEESDPEASDKIKEEKHNKKYGKKIFMKYAQGTVFAGQSVSYYFKRSRGMSIVTFGD